MEAKQSLMQLINTASTAGQIISSPLVEDRFKSLYKTVHGIASENVADAFFAAEKFHFMKIINDNPNVAQCTKLSLYGIFMDVAVSGLSFDPSMKHLYVVPYNVNVGTKDAPRWEKRAQLQVSGYGELVLRQNQGQVKYADNPVLVYEGDHFKFGTSNGQTVLEHISNIPRQSDKIIAVYIKIVRHDNSFDYKVLTTDEIEKFRAFSKDKNSKAWTDGLAGMMQAKCIKHAFKSYPKVRVGKHSALFSETIENNPPVYDYGVDYNEIPENAQFTPTMIVEPATGEVHQSEPVQASANDDVNLDF